jgi:anti-anti-sigma factor
MRLCTNTVNVASSHLVSVAGAGYARIVVAGDHDISTIPILAAASTEAVELSHQVIVDLEEATFVDSAVIHWLLTTQEHVERRGGSTAIVAPPGSVSRHVLEVLGLADRLPLADSLVGAPAVFRVGLGHGTPDRPDDGAAPSESSP